MTGIMMTQIDWIPLSVVAGMRMLTIPNQSRVAKAFSEFTDDGRMRSLSNRDSRVP